MTERKFSNGDIIFREGELGDTFFQIRSGKIGIFAHYGEDDEQELTELTKDQYFGEMAVIDVYPRSATAVALEDTEVLEVTAGETNEFFQADPERILSVMRHLGTRLRDLTNDYAEISDTLEAAKKGSKEERTATRLKKHSAVYRAHKKFAETISVEKDRNLTKYEHSKGVTMGVETYRKGTVIFKEGELGDCMYDVHFGSVGIYKSYGTPEEKLLTELMPNSFFGEVGMVNGEHRSATAITLENDTTIETIRPENLEELFRKNPSKVQMILAHLSNRLRRLTADYMNACKQASELGE